jgi:hypothetical protein
MESKQFFASWFISCACRLASYVTQINRLFFLLIPNNFLVQNNFYVVVNPFNQFYAGEDNCGEIWADLLIEAKQFTSAKGAALAALGIGGRVFPYDKLEALPL